MSVQKHIHGADLFFSLLYKFGVRRIFGIPGDELEIFDALSHSQIEFVTTRHEQGAAFMASAVGKMTSLPGVCISTLGPGATNLTTAVAEAYQNRAPLIALSGQLERKFHKSVPLAHQYIDLEKLFKPITKATFVIKSIKDMPRILQRAVTASTSERKGPVHITLPFDVMEEIVVRRLSSFRPPRLVPISSTPILKLHRVLRPLIKSKLPVVFLGPNGQRLHPALIRQFEESRIPVMTSFLGKGSFPETSDFSLGTVSRHVRDKLSEVLDKTDMFLVIGYDYIEGVSPIIFKDRKVINIDTVSYKKDKLIQPIAEVVGDIRSISRVLAQKLSVAAYKTEWSADYIRQVHKERYNQILQKQNIYSFPFNPFRVIQALQSVLKGGEVIVSDVGIHKQVIGLGTKIKEPFGVHFSNGLSSMGFSLPFSAGLRFCLPKYKKIISINGDGGFLMNVQELETIKRYKLDIKIIVFVDGAFGMIKSNLLQRYQRVKNLDFTNPDFAYLAKSFGIKYIPVGRKTNLKKSLAALINSRGPALIAIPTKYS